MLNTATKYSLQKMQYYAIYCFDFENSFVMKYSSGKQFSARAHSTPAFTISSPLNDPGDAFKNQLTIDNIEHLTHPK